MDHFLDDLNPKQREAVLATEGPVLILAGPGSGKTKTLTHRIAHLIQKGILPEQILGVTFTNKAAEEMKTRIHALTYNLQPTTYNLLFIGTFHALCVRILRAHASKIGFSPAFTIFDTDDSLSLLKDVAKELEINPKQFPAGMIAYTISGLKSELISPEQYEETMGTEDLFPGIIHRCYVRYQARLKESNAFDFDDLLMKTVELFRADPSVCESYQERFRYVHVDEYQDTNHSQYVLMKMIAQKYGNIAVVGDDAQAIYSFRKADFRNILNFEKDWPHARVIILDQNYRSTQTILSAASEVISKNRLQKQKTLWTRGEEGALLEIVAAENERGEAKAVWKKIQEFIREGYSPQNIVILYRTNAQSRPFEEIFLERNFPYQIIGGIKFYQRKEVKDIVAYVRYVLNPKDGVSLKRIINVPPRGIGEKTFLAYSAHTGITQENSLELPQKTPKAGIAALHSFRALIKELQDKAEKESSVEFLKSLLSLIHYKRYIEEEFPNSEEREENVEELINLAARYHDLPPPQGLEKFVEDIALMSDQDEIADARSAVRMMTIHAAKGLEFRAVFIVGLEDGIFPHSRSLFNPGELEEERRLCYVALTRAKEKVILTYALSRMHFGSLQVNAPSRFLREIPEHLLEVREEIQY